MTKYTCLPGLEDGHWPSDLPGGPMIGQLAADHALASLSALQDSGKVSTTNGTCGPACESPSNTQILQSGLENRLRQLMDVNGSLECVLTWKHWDIALGPQICALRASGRRTQGNDSSGWPTPAA